MDKGKDKMLKYEVDHPDDNDSDVSAPSLDNEFGVPITQTPRVKKALTSANEKLRCSSREKNPVTWFGYNEYMAHHYAFTMKIAADQEPKSTSLHHKLEGEELKLPRKGQRKSKAGQKLKKPKAKPDVKCLTLELEGSTRFSHLVQPRNLVVT